MRKKLLNLAICQRDPFLEKAWEAWELFIFLIHQFIVNKIGINFRGAIPKRLFKVQEVWLFKLPYDHSIQINVKGSWVCGYAKRLIWFIDESKLYSRSGSGIFGVTTNFTFHLGRLPSTFQAEWVRADAVQSTFEPFA